MCLSENTLLRSFSCWHDEYYYSSDDENYSMTPSSLTAGERGSKTWLMSRGFPQSVVRTQRFLVRKKVRNISTSKDEQNCRKKIQ